MAIITVPTAAPIRPPRETAAEMPSAHTTTTRHASRTTFPASNGDITHGIIPDPGRQVDKRFRPKAVLRRGGRENDGSGGAVTSGPDREQPLRPGSVVRPCAAPYRR